jgi:uncharacterized spore protein YtfJ
MPLDDLVKGLLGELAAISKSDAVAGKVRDAGKAKVLPLSKISIGFGSGAGAGASRARGDAKSDASLNGGAVVGALTVEPRAFVVVGEDGVPHMLALKKGKTAVMRRGLQITPQQVAPALPAEPAAPRLDKPRGKP